MENMYGTNESMSDKLAEALRANDEMSIFNAVVDIYETSEKFENASEIYEKLVKKFKKEKTREDVV
jgi:rRNA biogenesis protein RRP5